MKTLYHGTNIDFQQIDLNKSKKFKDFGQGFYLTEIKFQAERLAKQRCLIEGGEVHIQMYEFDDEGITLDNKIKTLYFDNYSKDWAEFINLNRNKDSKNTRHPYDIVYGPIADDKVGLQIKLFNQELINIDTLIDRLKYIEPTFQYYFGTEYSLKYLKRIL